MLGVRLVNLVRRHPTARLPGPQTHMQWHHGTLRNSRVISIECARLTSRARSHHVSMHAIAALHEC
eukprot:15472647-Alexandrium_andersonii.AAC.1